MGVVREPDMLYMIQHSNNLPHKFLNITKMLNILQIITTYVKNRFNNLDFISMRVLSFVRKKLHKIQIIYIFYFSGLDISNRKKILQKIKKTIDI